MNSFFIKTTWKPFFLPIRSEFCGLFGHAIVADVVGDEHESLRGAWVVGLGVDVHRGIAAGIAEA